MTATPMLKVIWSPAEFFDPTSTRKRMRMRMRRNLVQVYQPMLKIHATLQGKKRNRRPSSLPIRNQSQFRSIALLEFLNYSLVSPFAQSRKSRLYLGSAFLPGANFFTNTRC